jgi:glycosyltransferase involved in cell wall biosynthesis
MHSMSERVIKFVYQDPQEMQTDRKAKVLFISHEATRSGAVLFLLNFLKWFRAKTTLPFLILIKIDGEMVSEFREIAPTLVVGRRSRASHVLVRKLHNLWLRTLEILRLKKLSADLKSEDIGLIYSNTMTNGQLLEALAHLDCPIITHVHELEQLIRRHGTLNLELVLKHTHHYVAASRAVKDNLVGRHNVLAENVDVVHSCIPAAAAFIDCRQSRSQVLESLAIPNNAMVIGGCGPTNRHKGTDLFVQLARTILDRYRQAPVHFIWVGPETRELSFNELSCLVERLGLNGHVHFVGEQAEPLRYFAAFDLFALTSLEESLGLGMLEAASLRKPTVCFGSAGGPKEFIEEDCGCVIRRLDIKMMAEEIIHLLGSHELREELGRRAAEKVSRRFTMDYAAPRVLSVIQNALAHEDPVSS